MWYIPPEHTNTTNDGNYQIWVYQMSRKVVRFNPDNVSVLLIMYLSCYLHLFPYSCIILDIKNTRRVSFDIKFTRQGFENACWHREACRAIQHALSKPSLVKLIIKDTNLVFYLSVYPLLNTLQTSDFDVILRFVLIQRHKRRHSKSATSSCREIGNVY